MKYLLDTNICIYFLKGQFKLEKKFESVGLYEMAISEITVAELVFGAENSQNPSHNLETVEKFSEKITILPLIEAVKIYGKEKSRLRKEGKMISDFDLLIGATAITNDLVMVTRNVKEFKRIKGIKLENWIDD